MERSLYYTNSFLALTIGVIIRNQRIRMALLALIFSLAFTTSYSITDALKVKIQNTTYSDETVVRFLSTATENFDSSCDAWKFFSSNPIVPAIYTKIDSISCLSINALPPLCQDRTIVLFTKVGSIGNYTFTATELGAFASNILISLEDTETGYIQDIRNNPTYSFTVSDTGIYNANKERFVIHFSVAITTAILGNQNANTYQIYYHTNNVYIKTNETIEKIRMYDISGKLIMEQEFPTNTIIKIDGLFLPSQLLIVEITCLQINYRTKLLIFDYDN